MREVPGNVAAPPKPTVSERSAPGSRSSPDRSDRRPPSWGWLAVGIVAVIALVAAVRWARGEEQGHEIGADPPVGPERLVVRVIATYPHDTEAFTQGLLWHEGHLYESTGLHGRSTVREVDLETGEVLRRREVGRDYFAEGMALVGGELIQLTWQEERAFVYRVGDFSPVREIPYDGEGWGLTYDGTHLVMSDGSDHLTFRDPRTLAVARRVRVHDMRGAIEDLNELEHVDGAIWANVWQTNHILRIDPRTGRVTAMVDAAHLLTDEEEMRADVLNGIAWVPEREHFLITGKNWPHLFEVEFVPRGRGRRDAGR